MEDTPEVLGEDYPEVPWEETERVEAPVDPPPTPRPFEEAKDPEADQKHSGYEETPRSAVNPNPDFEGKAAAENRSVNPEDKQFTGPGVEKKG